MKYHDIQLTGSLQVTGSLAIPTGTTAERPANPNSGSIRLNSSNGRVEIYTAVSGAAWEVIGAQTEPAAPVASANIEYLVIAGGGGGGARAGGGGGAGGYLSSSLSSIESGSSITVTVGAGGSAGTGGANGQNGGDGVDSSIASAGGTSFTTVTATGGGGGNGADASGTVPDGGSGGGASYSGELTGGLGTTGQGFDGGDAVGAGSGAQQYKAGGGGGASEVGQDGNDGGNGRGGNGGDGLASSITGTSTTRAGGGGGGTHNPSNGAGSGGSGGGGDAGTAGAKNLGNPGTANTGGGGGGGSTDSSGDANSNGAAGGSGVVILAYNSGSVTATGGKITTRTDGHVVHTFKTSSTFTVGGPSDYPTSQIPTTNLVLHLDPTNSTSYGGSGTTITNLGSGPNASLIGAGFTDNYWTLDGTNDYIQSVDDGSYDIATSADITMIVWVYVTTTNQYAHFMAWDGQSTAAFKAAGSAYAYQIYWYTPSYSTYNNLSTGFTYGVNAWYQLAMVRRSGVWEAYKNGVLIGNDSDAADTAGFSCTNLNMGYGGVAEWTAQRRGPMLLYNGTALTSDQISLNYDHYKGDYGLS